MEKGKKRALFAGTLLALALGMALLALLLQLYPPGPDASTREGRRAFLAALGWEIDPGGEERKEVLIPDCSTGVMAAYNALQLRQGYDLSRWEGQRVAQFSYRVTNYPGYDGAVYAVLYVSGRRVIGGDVHSAALNGFMHGLGRDTE